MISYLKVENMAIVARAEIEPTEGFNVLTGETGAGKSLLIDSLQLLSGARGSSELVRSGAKKLTVEAVAFVSTSLSGRLEELGIEFDEQEEIELVIRREIGANGRGRAQVNGTTITTRDLSSLMERVIEIHGQHQSITRIGGRTWREMLDEWSSHDSILENSGEAFRVWKDSHDDLEQMRGSAAGRLQRIETIRYRIAELDDAAIEAGERKTLRDERSVLANSEELSEVVSTALDLITESDDSASSLVGRVSEKVTQLARKVESLTTIADELEDVLIRLEEIGRSVGSIGSEVRHDPARLEQVETRLAMIERMERKYALDDSAIPVHLEELKRELESLEDFDGSLEKAASKERSLFNEFIEIADQLSDGRKSAAREVGETIERELGSLAMEKARIRFEVTTRTRSASRLEIGGENVAFGPEGYDSIALTASMNPGEPLRELSKVASGGELSRLQLAIASAMTGRNASGAPSTLVFDEIDAGVGGRIADVVGRKLRALSKESQVICVTHLPQIAGLAATQFHVEKTSSSDQTTAEVSELAPEDRVQRIAEMLAGNVVTGEALANARALLDSSSSLVESSP